MLRPSWTTCSLQELPFLPFRPQDQLERSVLEYISARLLGLARHKRREYGSSLTLKSFSFYESNCIAGIDISSIQKLAAKYDVDINQIKSKYSRPSTDSSLLPPLSKTK